MERFLPVSEINIDAAALIHAASWKESHKAFCTPAFVKKHTPRRQKAYLRKELEAGKRIWLLEADGDPVGIVSVWGSLIENLYVHPTRQNRGHGTRLLRFAAEQCEDTPTLWILDNNDGARRLYERNGFALTGESKRLSDTLSEVEMALK